MNKSLITLALMVAFLSLFIVGCGGGDGTVGVSSNSNPTTGDGTANITVDWPKINETYAGLEGKAIYTTVDKIKVDFSTTSPSAIVATKDIARSTTPVTSTISVPAGTYQVDFYGMAGTTLMSRYRTTVTITAGQSTTVTATLGIMIVSNGLLPADTYMKPGDEVYWYNHDTVDHYLKFSTGNQKVAAGGNYKTTFTNVTVTTKYDYELLDPNQASYSTKVNGSITVPAGSSSYSYDATKSGVLSGKYAGLTNLVDVAVTDSNVYALVPSGTGQDLLLEKYDSAGSYVGTMNLSKNTSFPTSPSAIAIDSAGNIYVVDKVTISSSATPVIYKYDSNFTTVETIES